MIRFFKCPQSITCPQMSLLSLNPANLEGSSAGWTTWSTPVGDTGDMEHVLTWQCCFNSTSTFYWPDSIKLAIVMKDTLINISWEFCQAQPQLNLSPIEAGIVLFSFDTATQHPTTIIFRPFLGELQTHQHNHNSQHLGSILLDIIRTLF